MVQVHDVVVVGAGPGGAATAHFLAQHGLDVLVLDRAEFPRDKTCGDGLTPRALRILDAMDLLEEVGAQACAVDGYEVVAPNGRSTTAPITGDHQALVIPRLTLDHLILQRAIASGATFEPRVTVTRVVPDTHGAHVQTSSGQTHTGRLVVIATGAATGVLQQSGILTHPPQRMLAARAYFDNLDRDLPTTFQLRFDGVPSPGYGWVFPTTRRATNVGVGFIPTRRSGTATHAFERFIRTRAIATLLNGARQAGPVKGYPIRVDFLRSPTFARHTLLVGEAAGLVNPLTGEGIDYALESGSIAAEHIVHGLTSGLHPTWFTDYDRLLRARFEKVFRFSEWIRDWYCRPPLLNLLVPLANRQPELRQQLANIVLGEREPHGYGPMTLAARLVVYLARHRGVPAHNT
ncbi:MAG: geranylgeranyl reductase family protein [Chloroflexi bacterium]|nr:geranylgeranyl reductase family protein [Chloroflexota bacterium]